MLQKIKENPEVLFILSVLFYWVSTSYFLNPVAIVLMILGLIMMLKKIKTLAVILGVLYLIINGYMVLALMSEFREFPDIDSQALLMLGVGSSFIAINIFIGLRLIINNIPMEEKVGQLT